MKVSTVVLLVLLVVAGAWFAWKGSLLAPKPVGSFDNFAKCLTEKGAAMYGASWCSHCKNQKKMFGSSWQYVNYVECASSDGGQTQACKDKGITGYPTWDISGEFLSGEISLQVLSDKSGCPLS